MRTKDLTSGWHLFGRLAITLLLSAGGLACATGHPQLGATAPSVPQREGCPRVFVLLVDAVPFPVVAAVTSGPKPLFSELDGPWPVISTFPSSTSIAMGGIFQPLGLEPSPGYEARFYDAEAGKVRGGGLLSYRSIPFPWRHGFFHWKTLGTWRKAVGYSHPLKFGHQEIHRALEAFLASDEPLFLAYMTSTDAAAHLKGPRGLEKVLGELDEALRQARARSPEPFRVVILSDHGVDGAEGATGEGDNEPLTNTFSAVKQALHRAGFHPGRRVHQSRDVAVVALGLLSSLALGTQPGEEIAVARAVVAAEGVELCAARVPDDENRWWVQGIDGGAWIERHGEQWSYRPEDGDPLGYASVVEGLRNQSAGTNGSTHGFPPSAWLAATHDHRFPDALGRIAGAFSLVTHPPSVVCSTAPGFMFGPTSTALTSRLTKGPLRWTHGALDRGATLGFLLTDIEGYSAAPALRAEEALAPLVPLLDPSSRCPLDAP